MKSVLLPAMRDTGKAVDAMSSVLGTASGVLLTLCALVVTYNVIARYVFRAPTGWTFEISILLMLVAVFFAVSYGLREGSHVSVHVLIHLLPAQTRKIFEIISYVFVLGYAVVFTRYALVMVTESFALSEKSDFLSLPVWPVKAAFAAAFIVLSLQAFRMLITKCYLFFTSQPSEPARPATSALMVLALIVALALGVITSLWLNPAVGLIVLLLIVLAAGIPISFALGIVGTIGFISVLDVTRGVIVLPQVAYWVWDGFTIMALPLFIFVGHIMYRSGLADELFQFARV